MFSEEECKRILRSLEKLSHLWVPQGPDFGPDQFFFTVGAVTYIDYGVSSERYEARVAESNNDMRREFGWAYEKIQSAFESLIGRSVISPDLGPPGFHVFSRRGMMGVPGDPEVRKMMAKSLGAPEHYDIQHLYHKEYFESFSSFDFERTLSFTIPVLLPDMSCGLNVHDPNLEVVFKDSDDYLSQTKPDRFFIDYSLGNAFYHFGKIKHQIAANESNLTPGSSRITIQGHGVMCDGVWQLYF